MLTIIAVTSIFNLSIMNRFGSILVDSSGNGYTLWKQHHECISYHPNSIIDALIIVNREYTQTGYLRTHEAPGDLSFWVHDTPYQGEIGVARYPTALAGIAPYIVFPYLILPSWGSYAGTYGTGGWFSIWSPPMDFGYYSHDLIVIKQFPDTLLLAIAKDGLEPRIVYYLLTPSLQVIDTGTVAFNATYWGYDLNGGVAAVFYFDSLQNICYKTTTDGTNWSSEYTWNLAFIPPYPNASLNFTQMALTDDGQPRLVFECLNLDDATYPYYSKIYISYASGVPPVELTASLPDTEAMYPTIACGGNKCVAIFNIPRNDLLDSLTWMDIHMCASIDNGITWTEPSNITSWSTSRLGLQQIAKRLDTLRNQFFYVYAVDMVVDHDPLWHVWLQGGLDGMYIYAGYAPIVGIEENEGLRIPNAGFGLEVYPNLIHKKCNIKYVLPQHSNVNVSLFDVAGRLIKEIVNEKQIGGVYYKTFDMTDLPQGIYFFRLETRDHKETRKAILLK